jgi:hypothetical protein
MSTETRDPELIEIPPEMLPDEEQLETEDDTPVDNIFSEKQQRLLTECLFSSWPGPGNERPFVALANVGFFYAMYKPPLVPDMLLSLDVRLPENLWPKKNRSYFIWRYGKPPEVVIEVVSNRKGNEDSSKFATYAEIGVPFYVIFDPDQHLSTEVLRIYGLQLGEYQLQSESWLAKVQLGLRLWEGSYEDMPATWLRWCNQDGTLIPTGSERAEQERERAEQERERAEQERERAEQEHARAEQEYQRAERLAARLRELGIDPEET